MRNKGFIKNWRKNFKAIEKYQFIYHFLPHPERKKRAPFLSHKAFIVYIITIIALSGIFRILPKVVPGILGYASNINVSDLLVYTNKKRNESGLGNLVINDQLSRAAAAKAKHMFEKDYWAHISPGGVTPWDFILGAGYDYVYAGENLARNFSNSKDVVEAWCKSPTHKENLMSSNYDEIGFAVVNGVLDGYETTLVVQMFGRTQGSVRAAAVPEAPAEDVEAVRVAGQPVEEKEEVEQVLEEVPVVSIPERITANEPLIDITTVSRSFFIAFGGFIMGLLVLDIWYSRKKGIKKFTGHTLAHLMLITVALVTVWFILKPGDIF